MQLWAVSMVKNEADVIEPVIRHLFAEGVDRILVAENLSTDDTPQILARLAKEFPLTMIDDPDPAYRQAEKIGRLVDLAREGGADWIVPFDADELWLSPHGRLRDYLAQQDVDVVRGGWYQHRPRLIPRRDPFRSMVWRERKPGPWPKLAIRPVEGLHLRMGAHGIYADVPVRQLEDVVGLQIHHYEFRSFGQMVRKVRNGKWALELGTDEPEAGSHWRRHGAKSRTRIAVTWVRRCLSRSGLVRDQRLPSV